MALLTPPPFLQITHQTDKKTLRHLAPAERRVHARTHRPGRGSGFIGSALAQRFVRQNYHVVVLTRDRKRAGDLIRFAQWDGRTKGDWVRELDGAIAVVNLTGKTINCRHTPENRREILRSRVGSVRVLGEAISRAEVAPKVFVQASATGFYGDSGDRVLDEHSPTGQGFMADVCRQWEDAFLALDLSATRKVILRISVVLGHDGGALKTLATLTRAFLGGAAGDGRQFMSWIHLDDLTRMFLAAIERGDLHGIFNAAAPNPVTECGIHARITPQPSPSVESAGAGVGGENWRMVHGDRREPCANRPALHAETFPRPRIRIQIPGIARRVARLVRSKPTLNDARHPRRSGNVTWQARILVAHHVCQSLPALEHERKCSSCSRLIRHRKHGAVA